MAYKIGEKVWFKGDEATIISEPFILSGGEFQKATLENGKEIVVATPAQKEKNSKANREAFTVQQSEFRNLR